MVTLSMFNSEKCKSGARSGSNSTCSRCDILGAWGAPGNLKIEHHCSGLYFEEELKASIRLKLSAWTCYKS